MRKSQRNELVRLPINSDLLVFGVIASVVFFVTAVYLFYTNPWHPDHKNQYAYISNGMARNPGWSSLLYGSSISVVWLVTIITLWGLERNFLILISTISMICFMGIIGYVQIKEPHIILVIVSIGTFLVVQYFICTSKFGNTGYKIVWVISLVLAASFIASLYIASATNYIPPYVSVSAGIEMALWAFIALLNGYMTVSVFGNKNRLFELNLVQSDDEYSRDGYNTAQHKNKNNNNSLPYTQLQKPSTLNNNMWDYLSQYSNNIYNPQEDRGVYTPM